MGKATIRKKCITEARRCARAESTARVDGRSIFIKRYTGGNYRIIMVHVTKKQRAVRDMFADANVLAKSDMTKWNRVRHWERYARKHKKHGAYRAAVSFYYKMIREHGDELVEIKPWKEEEKLLKGENTFYWVKFDSVEEYMGELMRLCG